MEQHRFPSTTRYAQWLVSHRIFRSVRTFPWIILFAGAGAISAGSMSSGEVFKTLGSLGEGNRYNAIASLVRGEHIRSPLSSSDGASILFGTTQGARASSIGELARLLKADLNGQEAETILGPEATLSEGNRYNAIAALARGKRFGPSLAEDAALALKGTTQGSRAAAIGEIAPYLRADLPGQSIATILGSGPILSDGNRFNAIAAIARSGKKPLPLSGPDGAAILQGATQGSRAAAIGELALLFNTDLNGQEAEAILGPEATLSEGNRYNAIAALARGKRFGPSLAEDAALALKGTTQGSRAAAIGEIAPYLRADLPGQSIATILGRSGELTEGNRYNAIAALARAGKLGAVLSSDEMALILMGTSGQTRISAIAEVTNAAKRESAIPASGDAAQSISRPIDVSPSPTLPPAAGVTGGLQPAPSGVRVRIVASALGETINEGGTLKPRVPLYVGIEVSFRAFVSEDMTHSGASGGLVQFRMPPVTRHYRYVWFVDGKQFGEGEQFVRWFGGGTYKVEARADLVSATALSTPQTILPDPQKLRASVLVFVDERKEWDCKGRLGRMCNDKPGRDDTVTSPVTVVPDCTRKGKKGEICIGSRMSVGAISHDVCCDMHPNGIGCNGRESTSDCQAEWDQAWSDKEDDSLGMWGAGLITMFPGTWIYPPDGIDRLSAGKPGWWKRLAPEETIVSRSETAPTSDQQAICKSGKAEPRMARSLMAEGMVTGPSRPVLFPIWVCTKAPDVGQPVGVVSARTADMDQNCGRERSLKSTEFSSPTSVEFVNNGPQPVKIYWIDYVGQRVFYNSLGSGQSYIQQTFVTHPWIFTNANNQCLGIYLPTAQETKVSIP